MPIPRRRFLLSTGAAALAGAVAPRLSAKEISMNPQPFRIDAPQAALDDLAARLAATRFADQIPGSGWDYGTDTAYLRELVGYGREGFDWRAQEERLNAVPQFTVEIDGHVVHFLHVRSDRPGAVPRWTEIDRGGRFLEWEEPELVAADLRAFFR